MENFEIKNEINNKGDTGDSCIKKIYREYELIIKGQKDSCKLRLEIDSNDISFILYLNNIHEYNYKLKKSLVEICQELRLNLNLYSSLDKMVEVIDKAYEGKTFEIKKSKNGNYYILVINFEENNCKIKLIKHDYNVEEKVSMLFDEIKMLKNGYNNNINNKEEISKLKIQISKLNLQLKEKEEEIKNIKIENDNIINEIKEDLMNQINQINNKVKTDFELIIKKVDATELKLISLDETIKKLENGFNLQIKGIKQNEEKYNNNMKNDINNIKNDYKKLKKKIEEDEKKLEGINQEQNMEKMKLNLIAMNANKTEKKINTTIKQKLYNIDFRIDEINENLNRIIKYYQYEMQVHYKFISNPINLKNKSEITKINTNFGFNDLFEIFISSKNNKPYLVFQNSGNFNIDLIDINKNEKINSYKGHENKISTVRYFINKNNKEKYQEYLISADIDSKVIIWDIKDNYRIIHKINTEYINKSIYSCLLLFPRGDNHNGFIITSSFNCSEKEEESSTALYSMEDGGLIKFFNNTNYSSIFYLLSWYDRKNYKYYIIQFSNNKIIISDFYEDELFSELSHDSNGEIFSGFIYSRNGEDFLCFASSCGQIIIWDLFNLKKIQVINIGEINKCQLNNIIKWNDKYAIVSDYQKKTLKVIDLETYQDSGDINKINEQKDSFLCVKKFNHHTMGESLITAGQNYLINLWSL